MILTHLFHFFPGMEAAVVAAAPIVHSSVVEINTADSSVVEITTTGTSTVEILTVDSSEVVI